MEEAECTDVHIYNSSEHSLKLGHCAKWHKNAKSGVVGSVVG